MKGDKKFVVFIVFISVAITCVLQYVRSPEALKNIPYLNTLESDLGVFGEEGYTNEVYRISNQLKSDKEHDIIPVGYFIEEQRIIEEFTNEKQLIPILCRVEPTDYLSFYLSLTNNMNVNDNALVLKMKKPKSSDTIYSATLPGIKIVNSNHSITHKIMADDSLYKLAKRYYNNGSKWEKIYQANRNIMSDPHSLQIGQELLIPDVSASI